MIPGKANNFFMVNWFGLKKMTSGQKPLLLTKLSKKIHTSLLKKLNLLPSDQPKNPHSALYGRYGGPYAAVAFEQGLGFGL